MRKVDRLAHQSLEGQVRALALSAGLGRVERNGRGFAFEFGDGKINVYHEVARRFLGMTYELAVEGVWPSSGTVWNRGDERLELRYSGWASSRSCGFTRVVTRKGRCHDRNQGVSDRRPSTIERACVALNGCSSLLRDLRDLDLHFMKIWLEEMKEAGTYPGSGEHPYGIWKMRMVLMGGSYIWAMIPPISYTIRLREDECERIGRCLKKVQEVLRNVS